MSPECIPYYEPGDQITAHCEAAVVGKTFVAISDPRQGPAGGGLSTTGEGQNVVVSTCAADGKPLGVAAHDAAIGKKVGVIGGPGFIVPVTADGAITAGDEVEVGANGKVKVFDAGIKAGLCLDTVADAADAMIKLY
jgi:hypothetical protein